MGCNCGNKPKPQGSKPKGMTQAFALQDPKTGKTETFGSRLERDAEMARRNGTGIVRT